MKNIKEILDNASWMIRSIVDESRMSNEEEAHLVEVLSKAKKEMYDIMSKLNDARRFLNKLDGYLDTHDSVASNSLAHAELDELLKRINE